MRHFPYSTWSKAVALVLSQTLAVLIGMGLIISIMLIEITGYYNIFQVPALEETKYYQNEVNDQILMLLNAAGSEMRFEKNGEYSGNNTIDIMRYGSPSYSTIPGQKVEPLYYTIDDLLSWAEADYSLLYALYTEAEEQEVYSDSELAVETTDDKSAEEQPTIEEFVFPVNFENIDAYVKASGMPETSVQSALIYTLQNLDSSIRSYQRNLERFSTKKSNLLYMIVPDSVTQITATDFDQKTYTNLSTLKAGVYTMEDLANYFKSYGSYLIYNSADSSISRDSTLKMANNIIFDNVDSALEAAEEHYTLFLALDTSYPAKDALYYMQHAYKQLSPFGASAGTILVICGICYLLLLVYMTCIAGHRLDDDGKKLHLYGFDLVKTEAAAAVILMAAGILTLLALFAFAAGFDGRSGEMLGKSTGAMVPCAIAGGYAFFMNLLFLAGYLSLVRRMKARTVWKNSILYALLKGLAGFLKGLNEFYHALLLGMRSVVRTAGGYFLYILINGFLFILISAAGVLPLLLWFLFNGAVGLWLLRESAHRELVLNGVRNIASGELNQQIPTEKLKGDNKLLAEAVNGIGEGLSNAVEASMKNERLKTDLITNVSHDIKTPLTSIINYVDLIKREDIQDEKIQGYIEVLDRKSQRLKHLTEDLVEASKISSGNIRLELVKINFQELINQTVGEFSEKFSAKNLEAILSLPEDPVMIMADGRRIWRIVENLFNNVAKYAMPNSRVYVDLKVQEADAVFSIKNMSEKPLNIQADELTERFIRGDVSRNTEGSGLGLSIAKDLTKLQGGTFEIYLDGDLFRVTVRFPVV